MSIDGFLTFCGLLIAGYANLDPISRLRLRIDAPIQVTLISLALLVIIPFELVMPILGMLPASYVTWFVDHGFGQPSDLLTNSHIAFLAVLVWALAASLAFKLSRPTSEKIRRLLPLIEKLHDEGRYLELLEIIHPYASILIKNGLREGRLFKAYDWIYHASRPPTAADMYLSEGSWRSPAWCRWVFVVLRCALPSYQARTRNALKIAGILFKSKEARGALQTTKPKLAAGLFVAFYRTYHDWCDLFFAESMMNKESHLRRDLKRTNWESANKYDFHNDSIFLSALIGDAEISARMCIWKPIGDAVTKAIKEDKFYQTRLHDAPPQDDVDLFDDITYAGIHFFDILVRQAAVQEKMNHMWLMYLRHFVENLNELPVNEAPPSGFGLEAKDLKERLIFETILRLEDWVELGKVLPDGNLHKAQNNSREARKVDAIPYWAAKTLADTMRVVILSSKLSDDFKASCLIEFIRTGARRVLPDSYLRELLADSLFHDFSEKIDENVLSRVKLLRSRLDAAHLSEFPEFSRYLRL